MPRVDCADHHAKSPSARVLRGQPAGSPWREARAGRTARDPDAVATRLRSRSRRPGAVSVRKSLSQRRGWERPLRWPRDHHAESASARVLRGHLAGSPWDEARAGRRARSSNDMAERLRSRSRRPGAESMKMSLSQRRERSMPRVDCENHHAKSPSACVCSVDSRPDLHGANRA